MTAAKYSVFGLSMERRSARRKLVALMYAVLAAFCTASMAFARTHYLLYSLTLDVALAVAFFVFGGTGRYGLIKPFPNKPPRPEPAMARVMRMQLAPMTAGTPDESSWKNDERELSRRDQAHYQAFKVIGVAVVVILMVATLGQVSPTGVPHAGWLTAILALNVIYGIALVGCVLVLTLPSAIILWTEQDVDAV